MCKAGGTPVNAKTEDEGTPVAYTSSPVFAVCGVVVVWSVAYWLRKRSASSAALQPLPAATMAWR